jgi:hypothetical protein
MSGTIKGTHAVVERVYRVALRGTSPDYALLGEATGTQFRRFVDDLLQLLAWYPSPELSPRSTDPQNLHLAFRKEILAIVGALVLPRLMLIECRVEAPTESGWPEVTGSLNPLCLALREKRQDVKPER